MPQDWRHEITELPHIRNLPFNDSALHNPRVFTVVRGGGEVSTEKVNTGNRGLEETEREEGGRQTDRPLRGR